jgi:mRNA-degrading endonuclease RelE of RelBE toxin-antitoxin system
MKAGWMRLSPWKKLETAPEKRYSRVGDWRIVYEIEADRQRPVVITIQHRSKVYKEVK